MKKIYILTLLFLLAVNNIKINACGGDGYEYYGYYTSFFSQELINDPRFFPFLWAPYDPFYEVSISDKNAYTTKNANIEEWQQYLGINYDNAYYLVFKSSLGDINNLLSGEKIDNDTLSFANKQFVNKYREALKYLQTAKELEPYMRISGSGDSSWYYYGDGDEKDVDGIEYNDACLKLQKEWKETKDKELKLRYGYQLVRLAHYKRAYEEAIQFFDKYVEPLTYKPEMYYYALSQYAGALRGQDSILEANKNFFKVFCNSSDLKEMAYSSMRFTEDIEFRDFVASAETIEEKNDLDLLLGFVSFSNPLNSAQKIIDRSPDASQAKVLVARALSQIEDYIKTSGDFSSYKDKRLPIVESNHIKNLKEVLNFVTRQANSENIKKPNFWNIASAYMYYLSKNYEEAQRYLDRIDIKERGYKEQSNVLAMLVDIGREPEINNQTEERIFNKYRDVFEKNDYNKGYSFVMDILGNRYFLQGDYAKSFMLQSSLNALEDYPKLDLLDEIDLLYNKPNKNSFEKYLASSFKSGVTRNEKSIPVQDYLDYMRGVVYLTADNTAKASEYFNKSSYSSDISSDIFGYNSIECYTCEDNMKTDYLSEFSFIKPVMNERELVNALRKLKNAANLSDQKAAKANYLLGNFYYNVSVTGYFRNYLRFGYVGGYRQGFFCPDEKNYIYTNQVSMKYIPTYYDNPVNIAEEYLTKAYQKASGNEFKARIIFALSKCELEIYDQNCNKDSQRSNGDWILISDRKNFAELMKYQNTEFFKQVKSNCKYFEYYVDKIAR